MVNTEGIWMVDGVGMSAWALGHQHPQRLAFVARPKDKVPGAACERFTGSLLLTVSKMELTELKLIGNFRALCGSASVLPAPWQSCDCWNCWKLTQLSQLP